ncbi:unnamed protein product [Camellia sinensis]
MAVTVMYIYRERGDTSEGYRDRGRRWWCWLTTVADGPAEVDQGCRNGSVWEDGDEWRRRKALFCFVFLKLLPSQLKKRAFTFWFAIRKSTAGPGWIIMVVDTSMFRDKPPWVVLKLEWNPPAAEDTTSLPIVLELCCFVSLTLGLSLYFISKYFLPITHAHEHHPHRLEHRERARQPAVQPGPPSYTCVYMCMRRMKR